MSRRRFSKLLDRLRRIVKAFVVLVLVTGLAGLWFLSPEARQSARFAHADCRRLALTDPRTGKSIVGIEDLALAPNGDTLILSAYDRQDPKLPEGGLYALNFSTIWNRPVALLRLDQPRSDGTAFRPHGIALDAATGELAVINRTGAHEARVEVGPIGPLGWTPSWEVSAGRLCRANDLTFRPGGLYVTIDRIDCTASFRDLIPWSSTGSIARVTEGAVVFESTGLNFPNGINGDAVAETRAKSIRLPGNVNIALPGGPDNLTRDADGALVAAVHPGLLRLFLMRQGVFEKAGSRIVRIDATGAVELLFDDPGAELVSGATVGMLIGNSLVIGSATDAGLLVCEGGE